MRRGTTGQTEPRGTETNCFGAGHGRRAGPRATVQQALNAANAALGDLPRTPAAHDELAVMRRTMSESLASAELKADRLAAQVQQLFAELQRKDREISTIHRAKSEVEERWSSSEIQQVKETVPGRYKSEPGEDGDLTAMTRGLVAAAHAGPNFQKQLQQFIVLKQEERQMTLVRQKLRDLHPFARRGGQFSQAEILQRVRDCIYRKGVRLKLATFAAEPDGNAQEQKLDRFFGVLTKTKVAT